MADPKNDPKNPINEPKERFVKTRAVADVLFKGIGGFMRGLGVDAPHISVSSHQNSAESPKTPQNTNKGNLGESSGVEEFQIPPNPQLEDAIRQATSSRFDPDQHPAEAIQTLNKGFVALADHVKMGFDRVAVKFDEHAQNVTNQFHHMLHEYEDLQDRLKVLELQSTLGDKKTLQDDIDKAELRKKLAELEDQIRNMPTGGNGGIPWGLAGAGLAGLASSLLNGTAVGSIAALMWLKKQNPYHFRTGPDQKITDDQWLKMTPEQRKKAWEESQNENIASDLKRRGWSDEEIQAFEKKSPFNKMVSSMWDVVTGNDVHDEASKKLNEQREEKRRKYGTDWSFPEDISKSFGWWDKLTKSPKQLREILEKRKLDAVPIEPQTSTPKSDRLPLFNQKTFQQQVNETFNMFSLPGEKNAGSLEEWNRGFNAVPYEEKYIKGEKDSGLLEEWNRGFNAVPVTEPPPLEKKKKPWYQYLNPFYKGSLEQQEEDAIPQHAKPVMYSPVKTLDLENAQSKPPTAENALPDSILTSQPDIDIEKRNISLTAQESLTLKATNELHLEANKIIINGNEEVEINTPRISLSPVAISAIQSYIQGIHAQPQKDITPTILERLKGYFGLGKSKESIPGFDESGKRIKGPLESIGEDRPAIEKQPYSGGMIPPSGVPIGKSGIGTQQDAEKAVDQAATMMNMTSRDRDILRQYMRGGGNSLDPSTQNWCAAFVGASLQRAGIAGIQGASKNIATSYLNWGRSLKEEETVRKGDVLVLPRGHRAGETGGHVGFATGETRTNPRTGQLEYQMLSGNPKVQTDWRTARSLVVRRAIEPEYTNQQQQPTGKTLGDVGLNNPNAVIDRSKFNEELKNPNVRNKMNALILQEVGVNAPDHTKQAFVESVFNRAQITGKTLDQTMNPNYYAHFGGMRRSWNYLMTHPEVSTSLFDLQNKVLSGSNISGAATDNASGGVAANALRKGFVGQGYQTGGGGIELIGHKIGGPGDPDYRPRLANLPLLDTKSTAVRNERIDSAFGALEQKPSPFAKLFTSPNERVASVFDAMQQPSPSQPATSLKPEEQAVLQENVKSDWKKLEPTPEQKTETEDVWKRTDQQRNADGSFPMQGKQVTNPIPFKDIDRNTQSLAERYGSISGMPTNHPEAAGPSPGSDGYGDQKSNPDGGGGICAI